jgi:hypothetical protein
MESLRGRSFASDAREAVVEATASFAGTSPDLLLAFASTRQDPSKVHAELRERFPKATIAGCTTTGELMDGEHANGSLTVAALFTPNTRWSVQIISPLSAFEDGLARSAVEAAARELEIDVTQVDPRELVGILLSDGLSCKEESVAAAVAEALEGVPLVGGSAGDDCAFRCTEVIGPQGSATDAALLVVGHGPAGFYRIVKHQHFTRRAVSMAVTKADPKTRRVYEIDGILAVDAYAKALGLTRENLTQEASFLNPVLVNIQGQLYVRSVQTINDDGSLTFYCAVDEGWLLDIAGHDEMVPALEHDLAALADGKEPPALLLGFNCILRALEAEKRGLHEEVGALVRNFAPASVGFDTYGEVLNGLHINQTLVAIGFDRSA